MLGDCKGGGGNPPYTRHTATRVPRSPPTGDGINEQHGPTRSVQLIHEQRGTTRSVQLIHEQRGPTRSVQLIQMGAKRL